jgi:hypothetical protein
VGPEPPTIDPDASVPPVQFKELGSLSKYVGKRYTPVTEMPQKK